MTKRSEPPPMGGSGGGERRDARGDGDGGDEHDGGEREDPRRLVGADPLLVEELANVVERLEDRCADATLESGADLAHAPEEDESADRDDDDLDGTGSPPSPRACEAVVTRAPPVRPR